MKKLYIETYGCQMNVNDTEVVFSILGGHGYERTEDISEADVIMANTCSIRDNAEQRIWGRIDYFNTFRKAKPELVVGILGCMAERLKDALLDTGKVNVVAGPDAYRRLPELLEAASEGHPQIDVILSREETYADINPVRIDKGGVSAFISIMRGCNNVCSYCVVPYTRGVERSRDARSIVREACDCFGRGYREVTLLGQNVDSYNFEGTTFADLLEMVAGVSPRLRVRFSTSNPQDISDAVLETMAAHPNICRHIHLPVQSGNDRILKAMNRHYTREKYLSQVALARQYMPDLVLTTDIIVGFPGETDEEFQDTITLCEEVRFDAMFTFIYSKRVGTPAASMPDPFTREEKQQHFDRLTEVANAISGEKHAAYIGSVQRVLIDGKTGRDAYNLSARTNGGRLVHLKGDPALVGRFADVTITGSNTWALAGKLTD